MRTIFFLIATLCGASLVSGADSTPAKAGGADKKLKLVLVSNNSADYWYYARAGCNAAKKQLRDVDVQFHINESGDASGQLQILKKVMAEKPDGVAVSVNDLFKEIDYLDEVADQCLLTCFDSDASVSKRACYIGTDNLEAGVKAGEMIKECLPEGGKIILFVGNMESQNAIQRQVGIMRALRHSKITIEGILTDDADKVRAQQNAKKALAENPDVGCLVGLWSYNGPAILRAVRDADKIGKVKIVCFDDDPETLVGVGSGSIYGTVVQNPFEIGKQTVTVMSKYLRGDKAAFGEEKKIYIPSRKLKQADIGDYLLERQKLLSQ